MDVPGTTPTSFEGLIRNLRDAGIRRRRASLVSRCEETLARSRRAEAAFAFLDRVESAVRRRAADFMAEAPGFELGRDLRDGGYLLSLRHEETRAEVPGRREVRISSRLEFLVRLHPHRQHVDVSCRKSVRNRDGQTSSLRAPMTLRGLVVLRCFLEEQFLNYAEEYFRVGFEYR